VLSVDACNGSKRDEALAHLSSLTAVTSAPDFKQAGMFPSHARQHYCT
jgi:hypothetical protein